MAVAGSRQSVNLNVASGCGAITCNRSVMSNPGSPAGTMNADNPRAPGASPVQANSVYTSAMPPFEIHVFSPFNINSSPSRVAVMVELATSEPDCGSVSAKADIAFPVRVSGNQACCCSTVPKRLNAPVPSPCIAKLKSANPSCRASVSRIKHKLRTSKTAPASAPVCCNQPASPSLRTSHRQAPSTSL